MTKLGESKVSLTQDVVKRKPLIVSPTFMEWVSDGNAEQIARGRAHASALVGTMFSVPANFSFFLTSCTLSISCSSGAPGARAAAIFIDTETKPINRLDINLSSSLANSLVFSMPMKVNSFVKLSSPANAQTAATITGFLLSKKISIR